MTNVVPEFQSVCGADEIADGKSKAFMIGTQWVGIFRVGNEFFALDNRCPHAGASLAHGEVCGEMVRCRIHHWGFRLRDGVYVDENKPTFNATTFPVRVRDNRVEVCLNGKP